MAVLVCGGAGYIGSHNVRALQARGEDVLVLDNLLTGHAASLPDTVRFIHGDMRDTALLDSVFSQYSIDAVLHFAASSLVGESMQRPLFYFNNNVQGMQALLETMQRHQVNSIVFSSTAAVYGEPDSVPITEEAPLRPGNPYGDSKLMMERMMHWAAQAHGMRAVILRYFNVGGALPGGAIGEDHRPESHLIPLILQVALGKRPHITVYGDDWPTPDGTCIRDYLDVMDLADAHMRALDWLRTSSEAGRCLICNLGNGQGFSVRQMIEAARAVTGHAIPAQTGSRRAGDPAQLVASAERAKKILGWTARADITAIIASAWAWHQSHPDGFAQKS